MGGSVPGAPALPGEEMCKGILEASRRVILPRYRKLHCLLPTRRRSLIGNGSTGFSPSWENHLPACCLLGCLQDLLAPSSPGNAGPPETEPPIYHKCGSSIAGEEVCKSWPQSRQKKSAKDLGPQIWNCEFVGVHCT